MAIAIAIANAIGNWIAIAIATTATGTGTAIGTPRAAFSHGPLACAPTSAEDCHFAFVLVQIYAGMILMHS